MLFRRGFTFGFSTMSKSLSGVGVGVGIINNSVRGGGGGHASEAIGEPFTLKEVMAKMINKDLFAKVLIHNYAFTVVPADIIVTHRLKNYSIGDKIIFNNVTEIGSKEYHIKGLPSEYHKITATIIEHSRGSKVRARMPKQRKGRRALKTIKPLISKLLIERIQLRSPS